MGNPFSGGVKYRGGENWQFSTCRYFILPPYYTAYGGERFADTISLPPYDKTLLLSLL